MAKKKQLVNNHFELRTIKPLTSTQSKMFKAYEEGYNLICHGYSGTGKTFLSLYLALNELLKGSSSYNKIVLLRSVVSSRDMGFLPGNQKMKAQVYEKPYREICDDLFGRGDGWNILNMKHMIEFETTSFLRGVTFNNSIVIADEINNMSFHELDTIMTRIGDNTRIIFSGDYRQSDLLKPHDKSGILEFMSITKRMKSFEHIEFEIEDIVRSGVIYEYIVSKMEAGF